LTGFDVWRIVGAAEAVEGSKLGTADGDLDGDIVGVWLIGDLNTTLKPDIFGLFTAPGNTMMLIVPDVTTTSTGKAPKLPYPSCANRSISTGDIFL
jgi:hypothetical protein